MGACCAVKHHTNLEKYLASKLTLAIEKNCVDRVRELIIKYSSMTSNKEPLLNINNTIVKIYSHDMNALGYALFLGYAEVFSIILDLGKAKLSAMTKFYQNFSKRPIDVICELGHKQLLECYLPYYLGKGDEVENSESDSISLSFSRSKPTKSQSHEKSKTFLPISSMPPIHRACEKARINVLKFLWEYFQNKSVPNEFSVHHQDENTGDNCALVACKTGSLELIRYLYEVCRANFTIFNKRKESAIQVLAVWSKKKKTKKFKDCFRYLIEVVGVDYTYEFEETLLVLEDKSIIAYLEEKLKNDGISISKSRVDDKYSISRNRVAIPMDSELELKLGKIKGIKFCFKEIFREELEESKVEISSISDNSIQSVSNITFMEGK